MMTQLMNTTIAVYSSETTRDDRGGMGVTPTLKSGQDNVAARVEVASSKQDFSDGRRQIVIDHVIYTEQSGIENGDFIEWPYESGTFYRVQTVKTYPAQGSLPTYYEIGAREIQI